MTDSSLDRSPASAADAGGRASPPPDLRRVLASPAAAIATMFGAGLFPFWPGTVGSVLALPLVYLLQPLDAAARGAALLVLFAVGVWAAHAAGRQFGEADHRAIVCDETWGMAAVWECTAGNFRWMLAGFVAFRLFDAAKPWPISSIDRKMKNGLGVMLDDGVAALAATVTVLALRTTILGAA